MKNSPGVSCCRCRLATAARDGHHHYVPSRLTFGQDEDYRIEAISKAHQTRNLSEISTTAQERLSIESLSSAGEASLVEDEIV